MTFLQLFLFVDVFIMGVVVAIAVRHGRTHLNLKNHVLKGSAPTQNGHLPPSVRQHLLEEAQANFQSVLERSAAELQKDLKDTTAEINKQLEKLGTEAVGSELERFRSKLEELTKQAESQIGGASTEITDHQVQLKAKMDEEIAAQKKQLLEQIDTKLADAVASFLIETLQHNVDLGAQTAYLTSQLEEHKAEFTKGVADEAPTT